MSIIRGRVTALSLRLLGSAGRGSRSITEAQQRTLRALLECARNTAFGRHYQFGGILRSDDLQAAFRLHVPVHSYTKIRDAWWHRCREGEKNITWPGATPYFCMSSGTSDASSKFLPVTHDMVKSVGRAGFLQMRALPAYGLSHRTFGMQALMLSSSTSFTEGNGWLQGDMSGISLIHAPSWMSRYLIRPSREISDLPSWNDRIEAMVKVAHQWKVGTVCGVPAWTIVLFERLIGHYGASNIHDIWPDFGFYIHGGVAFDQYERNFRSLLGKPVARMETYMASEGSFGFQYAPGRGIRLLTGVGIYYEFIPFSRHTFDEDGNCREGAEIIALHKVREGVNYAVVISTCAGAWRYIIGDVVTFTDASQGEIRIVGRTKQFLDVCGEHVSADNITRAVHEMSLQTGIHIGEFCVAGERSGNLFVHQWYLGMDGNGAAHEHDIATGLDQVLCRVNDDYRVMRQAAIKEVRVKLLPNRLFHDFLRSTKREGAMSKFPRVLKGEDRETWKRFLENHGHTVPSAT